MSTIVNDETLGHPQYVLIVCVCVLFLLRVWAMYPPDSMVHPLVHSSNRP